MDIELLRKQARDGIVLAELRNHNGYKELIDILKGIYISALEKLTKIEDADARATIKALEDIVSIIDDKINLGEQSRIELREEAFKNQTQTTS